MSDEEVTAFEDYFYHITAAKGSGEHALTHLLGPFAWARRPLKGRLHELKVCHPPFAYLIHLLRRSAATMKSTAQNAQQD